MEYFTDAHVIYRMESELQVCTRKVMVRTNACIGEPKDSLSLIPMMMESYVPT